MRSFLFIVVNNPLDLLSYEKKSFVFVLFLLLLFSSSFKGKNVQGNQCSLPVQVNSSVYGMAYSYDAAGNRISRSPNTVIFRDVPLQDSM